MAREDDASVAVFQSHWHIERGKRSVTQQGFTSKSRIARRSGEAHIKRDGAAGKDACAGLIEGVEIERTAQRKVHLCARTQAECAAESQVGSVRSDARRSESDLRAIE